MNFKKALKWLRDLIDTEEDLILKYAKVSSLLAEFEIASRENGQIVDWHATEQLIGLRDALQSFCIDEDSDRKSDIYHYLQGVSVHISSDGLHFPVPLGEQ